MISISIYEIVMQMLNFILLVWLLNKFLFKPLASALKKRTTTIQTNLEEAENKKNYSEKILEEQKNLLQKAHHEAKTIRKTTEEMTKKEKEIILVHAQEQAQKIITTAKKDIESNYKTAKNTLKNEVGLFAIKLSEKLIHKNLDKQSQENIIKTYINTIKN